MLPFLLFPDIPAADLLRDLSAAVVVQVVLFRDLSDDPGRCPQRQAVCRDIFRDHTACTDDGIVADRHARKDNDPCPEPYILPDMHRLVVLQSVPPQVRAYGMFRRADAYVRSQQGIVADDDVTLLF